MLSCLLLGFPTQHFTHVLLPFFPVHLPAPSLNHFNITNINYKHSVNSPGNIVLQKLTVALFGMNPHAICGLWQSNYPTYKRTPSKKPHPKVV